MLKLVLTGVWVCAVTLGSVYFSMQHASAPVVSDAEADRRASQEYVPGEMITIPSIKDGAVQGYFLAKLSFSASREGIAKLHAPLRQLVTDELYDMLVGSRFIDVADTATFDLLPSRLRSRMASTESSEARSFPKFWSSSSSI